MNLRSRGRSPACFGWIVGHPDIERFAIVVVKRLYTGQFPGAELWSGWSWQSLDHVSQAVDGEEYDSEPLCPFPALEETQTSGERANA